MEAKIVNSCLSNLFSIYGMLTYIHSYLHFFHKKQKHSYTITELLQVERYNGIIWQSILLALKTKNLPELHWEEVLAEALHASHSLLCTAINATPHEQLFKFNRCSTTEITLPTWLNHPRKILMKQYPRNCNHEPQG